jgi:hypothetical protein
MNPYRNKGEGRERGKVGKLEEKETVRGRERKERGQGERRRKERGEGRGGMGKGGKKEGGGEW